MEPFWLLSSLCIISFLLLDMESRFESCPQAVPGGNQTRSRIKMTTALKPTAENKKIENGLLKFKGRWKIQIF